MLIKRHILFLLLSFTTITFSAQTLAEARKLYAEGNFVEAKPVFEKLVKATPSNANYNLWYGVCALRSGKAAEALPYLQTAVKRRVQDSQIFLAEACKELYLYEDAVNTLETYIADLKRRRKTSAEAEALLEQSRNGLRMIRGVEQVMIIDSLVVDKADFVSHYRLGADAGHLYTTDLSLGGYDIFVTRHDTEDDTYFTPENIGMPFNSPYNDYMYAIDEFNNLGWFASDRYQPEGKVCIYVFIPNDTKSVYSFENTDKEKLAKLAKIHAIKDSWINPTQVQDAQKRLANINDEPSNVTPKHDFVFVINDNYTYYQLTDFTSPQARNAYNRYRQMEIAYQETASRLEQLRGQYATGDAAAKNRLRNNILQEELKEKELYEQMIQAAKEVRQLEKP